MACLAGCSRRKAPDYDTFRSQLLSDCLDSLANRSPDKTIKVLDRLRDAQVGEHFSGLAIQHEKLRLLLGEVNTALAAGDLDQAEQWLLTAGDIESESKSVLQTKQLLTALRALRAYRNTDAESMPSNAFAKRLETLGPYIETLSVSPRFSPFLARERTRLAAIKRQEREQTTRSLLLDLDRTILSAPQRAELLVAELAAIDPNHTLLALREAVLANDWRKTAKLARDEKESQGGTDCIEMVLCLYWRQLPEPVRRPLATAVSSGTPASLSGLLIRARHMARERRRAEAVSAIRELDAILPLSRDIIAGLIRDAGYTPEDFGSSQWRTPCPNVTDILLQMSDARSNGIKH